MPSSRPYRAWLGFSVVVAGALLLPLDFAVNVAFPSIADAFGLQVREIRWVVIAYVLTYGSLTLVCGKIGDLFGHKVVFRVGLIVSAAGLTACSITSDYRWLIFFRIVQGCGIALTSSCALALATSLFEERFKTRIVGLYQTVFHIGAAFAPVFGGLLVQYASWRGVFFFRVPLALAVFVVARHLPSARSEHAARPFDWFGAALLIGCMSAMLLAITNVELWSEGRSRLFFAILASGLLVGFVAWEARSSEPVIRLAAFRDVTFSVQQLASFVVNFFGFSVWLLVPFFLARLKEWSLLQQGSMLAVAGLGAAAGALFFARKANTTNARQWAFAGIAVCAAGLAAISLWTETSSWVLLAGTLFIQGWGLGVFQTAYADLVTAAMPIEQRGVAGSFVIVTRTIGVVSSAAGLTIVDAIERDALSTGATQTAAFLIAFQTTFLYASLGLFAALAITLTRPKIWFQKKNP